MWLLWSQLALAAAPAPSVEALVTPDGAYVLRVSPEQAWLSAEVSVAGAAASDVGPQGVGAELVVEGDLPQPGTMWITVSAALSDSHGVSWVFSVEPQVVPMKSPRMRRLAEERRCWLRRKGRS